jgi:hypothetical protein
VELYVDSADAGMNALLPHKWNHTLHPHHTHQSGTSDDPRDMVVQINNVTHAMGIGGVFHGAFLCHNSEWTGYIPQGLARTHASHLDRLVGWLVVGWLVGWCLVLRCLVVGCLH